MCPASADAKLDLKATQHKRTGKEYMQMIAKLAWMAIQS